MKKKFICMMAFVFCCSFMMPAMAVDLEHVANPSFPIESTNAQYEISGEDTFEKGTYVGEIYRVEMPMELRAVSFPNQGTVLWKTTWNDSGTTVTDRLVHNYGVNYSHQFVKYLTNTWQKASSYQKTVNETISWSVGTTLSIDFHEKACAGLAFQKSVTYSTGVTVTIPADSTRYSKLGLSSDFVGEYFYREILHGSTVASKTNDNFKAPVAGQQYLDVIYQ